MKLLLDGVVYCGEVLEVVQEVEKKLKYHKEGMLFKTPDGKYFYYFPSKFCNVADLLFEKGYEPSFTKSADVLSYLLNETDLTEITDFEEFEETGKELVLDNIGIGAKSYDDKNYWKVMIDLKKKLVKVKTSDCEYISKSIDWLEELLSLLYEWFPNESIIDFILEHKELLEFEIIC